MVCEALAGLLGVKKPYVAYSGDDLGDLQNVDYPIVKTHSFTPKELLPLLSDGADEDGNLVENTDTFIVVCKRPFMDAMVSKYFYERNVRPSEGLSIGEPFCDIFEAYPDIPDAAALNLLVEARTNWLNREIRLWHNMSETIVDSKVIVVNYDKFHNEPEKLVKHLNSYIKSDLVEEAIERASFGSMKKKYKKGFVRSGQKGEGELYFDDRSKRIIQNEIKRITA